jgi:hypothetical protein
MTTITNITAKFKKLVPGIAGDFIDRKHRTFKWLTEDYGVLTSNTRRKMNYSDQKSFSNITPFLVGKERTGRMDEPLVFNEEYLTKIAYEYAEAQVAAFTSKLEGKLGDLENVKLVDLNLGMFTFKITGIYSGRKVVVEQQVVFKVSNLGNPFCQWPARIYVDGKFHSEKAFKELPKRNLIVPKKLRKAPLSSGNKRSKTMKPTVKANPYREGTKSFAAFQMILDAPGQTLGSYIEAGARANTLLDAIRKGHVK